MDAVASFNTGPELKPENALKKLTICSRASYLSLSVEVLILSTFGFSETRYALTKAFLA